jgi:hypothetical protein
MGKGKRVDVYLEVRKRRGIYFLNETSACVVDRAFESRSGQTKDYKIGICCFSAKHAALRRKSKDRLVRNRDNMSELDDMSICRMLFR